MHRHEPGNVLAYAIFSLALSLIQGILHGWIQKADSLVLEKKNPDPNCEEEKGGDEVPHSR